MTTTPDQVPAPRVDLDPRLDRQNVFADVFGHLDPDAWLEVLCRSIDEPVIDGVQFPGFPPPEFQSQLHGTAGRDALTASDQFYRLLLSLDLAGPTAPWGRHGHLLDFGAGWGRINRLLLRDFPLRHIIGYEPSNRFASMARSCNPFVTCLSGGYLPDGILPVSRFDLIIGYSVFSHLSPVAAAPWFTEFQRITRPGGAVVMTTYGRRYFLNLIAKKAAMNRGEEVHWYHRFCVEQIKDPAAGLEAFDKGEHVWFELGYGELYGEAALGPDALNRLLRDHAPGLRLEHFDTTSLPQDMFVLRRT